MSGQLWETMISPDDESRAVDASTLALVEASVVEAMQRYVTALGELPTSGDGTDARANLNRVREHFRSCVRKWAVALRSAGLPPEKVLVQLKAMLSQWLGAPHRNAGIADQAIGWCITAYFEGDGA
jgi:hypothetical protein